MAELRIRARVLLAHIVEFLDEDVFGDGGAGPAVDVVANFLGEPRQIRFLDMFEIDLLLRIKSFKNVVAQEKIGRLRESLEKIRVRRDGNLRQNIALKSATRYNWYRDRFQLHGRQGLYDLLRPRSGARILHHMSEIGCGKRNGNDPNRAGKGAGQLSTFGLPEVLE